MDAPTADTYVSFVVPRQLVKQVKTALEDQGRSHPTAKIRAISASDNALAAHQGKFLVPTRFLTDSRRSNDGDEASQFLSLGNYPDTVEIITNVAPISTASAQNALEIAVRDWYMKVRSTGKLADASSSLQHTDVETLVHDLPKTYSIYGPLLLLPQHAFQMESWSNLLNSLDPDEIGNIFHAMCERLNVTHVATNAPIPLSNDAPSGEDDNDDNSNILRSPTNLRPLHGDFGPVCVDSQPSVNDFSTAFWAHTKQNGINQFWAPRYTMFSRGNVTEKARVLHMPSVSTAVDQGSESGCSAVDLYAGVGYFAFSYVAAGVNKVLCWDLNPWSIEGLRRGARENKWGVQVYYSDQLPPEGEGVEVSEGTRLVAFVESNEKALSRIEKTRDSIPPIRHVNCGLLPSSKGSYATAAAALDPQAGGWVHIHENIGVLAINSKAEKVRSEFERLIEDLDQKRGLTPEGERNTRIPAVEHIQRVKSYAPGVFHCVVDIFIPPVCK